VRAIAKVQQIFEKSLPQVHARRMAGVFAAVGALLTCGSVIGAKLGRHVASGTSHKHGIKRIDRLLGNQHLQQELDGFYRVLASLFVRPGERVVVLVDWTDCGRDMVAITAALALHGRALNVYTQVYSKRQLNSPEAHAYFLQELRSVLGEDVRPVIVVDAGFHVPFLNAVLEHGWDYVCRVRGNMSVGDTVGDWQVPVNHAYKFARRKPIDVPTGLVTHTHGIFQCRLVLVDRRTKRARKPPQKDGRRKKVLQAVRSAHQPWILATSLQAPSAEQVIDLYKSRMQIEATFRDGKSGRLGYGLEHSRTRCLERLAVQFFLVALASAIAVIAGIAAERQGLDRRYQANSLSARRVLSLAMLGHLVLADAHPLAFLTALREIREILQTLALPI
jgi:hypothetical protein